MLWLLSLGTYGLKMSSSYIQESVGEVCKTDVFSNIKYRLWLCDSAVNRDNMIVNHILGRQQAFTKFSVDSRPLI